MFEDRKQAGETLAAALQNYGALRPIVFALPRGGVPVAAIIARRLGAPLDLVLVRKLGAPEAPELAIGAVVDGASPATILRGDIIRQLGVSKELVEKAKSDALLEIERRRTLYLKDRAAISPRGRIAILVDDGLATGATMEAAVEAMRRAGASHVIVAVPVAPREAAAKFLRIADSLVCLETPSPFWSVGDQYRRFPQLEDADVLRELEAFDAAAAPPAGDGDNQAGAVRSRRR